ncbi:MAG: hypothetical protein ACLFM2_09335 [Halothece sp.]
MLNGTRHPKILSVDPKQRSRNVRVKINVAFPKGTHISIRLIVGDKCNLY